jgi:alkylation response protein AidB-like acyl-CoA dehydrogenase
MSANAGLGGEGARAERQATEAYLRRRLASTPARSMGISRQAFQEVLDWVLARGRHFDRAPPAAQTERSAP